MPAWGYYDAAAVAEAERRKKEEEEKRKAEEAARLAAQRNWTLHEAPMGPQPRPVLVERPQPRPVVVERARPQTAAEWRSPSRDAWDVRSVPLPDPGVGYQAPVEREEEEYAIRSSAPDSPTLRIESRSLSPELNVELPQNQWNYRKYDYRNASPRVGVAAPVPPQPDEQRADTWGAGQLPPLPWTGGQYRYEDKRFPADYDSTTPLPQRDPRLQQEFTDINRVAPWLNMADAYQESPYEEYREQETARMQAAVDANYPPEKGYSPFGENGLLAPAASLWRNQVGPFAQEMDAMGRYFGLTPRDELAANARGDMDYEGEAPGLVEPLIPIGGELNKAFNPLFPTLYPDRAEGKSYLAGMTPEQQRDYEEAQRQQTTGMNPMGFGEAANIFGQFLLNRGVNEYNQMRATDAAIAALPEEEREMAEMARVNLPSGATSYQITFEELQGLPKYAEMARQKEEEAKRALEAGDYAVAALLGAEAKQLANIKANDIVNQNMNVWSDIMYSMLVDPAGWGLDDVGNMAGGSIKAMRQAQATRRFLIGTETALENIDEAQKAAEPLLDAIRTTGKVERPKVEKYNPFAPSADSKAYGEAQTLWKGVAALTNGMTQKADIRKVLVTLAEDAGKVVRGEVDGLTPNIPGTTDGLGRLLPKPGALGNMWSSPRSLMTGRAEGVAPLLPFLNVIRDDLANLKSLAGDGTVQPFDYMSELGNKLYAGSRKWNGLDEVMTLPFGASSTKLRLLPDGTGVIDYLDKKRKVLGSSAPGNYYDMQKQHEALRKSLRNTGGKASKFLSWPMDIQKAIMNDMFLALRPANMVVNASSAAAMLFSQDAFTFTRVDDIMRDIMHKFGNNLPNQRLAELAGVGNIGPGGTTATEVIGNSAIDSAFSAVFGENNPVSRGVRGAYDAQYGKGIGPFEIGEQSFFAKGYYTAMTRALSEGWSDITRSELLPTLRNLQLPDEITDKLIGTVIEAGISGNKADIARTFREVISNPKIAFNVNSLNIPEELLKLQYRLELNDVFQKFGQGQEAAAWPVIQTIFAEARKPLQEMLAGSAPQVGTHPFTQALQTENFADLLDSMSEAGRRAGLAPDEVAARSKALADGLYKAEDDSWKLFRKELETVLGTNPNPQAWNVAIDFWNEMYQTFFEARRVVDEASRKAVSLQTTQAWNDKWKINEKVWTGVSEALPQIADKYRVLLGKPDYQSSRDWWKQIERIMTYDAGEMRAALQRQMGSVKDADPWADKIIAANRRGLDIQFAGLFEAFRSAPGQDAFDLLVHGFRSAQELGAKAAKHVADARARRAAKEMSEDEFLLLRNETWRKYFEVAGTYVNAYKRGILLNGFADKMQTVLTWTDDTGAALRLQGPNPDGTWQAIRKDGQIVNTTPPQDVVDAYNKMLGNANKVVEEAAAAIDEKAAAQVPQAAPPVASSYVETPAQQIARLQEDLVKYEQGLKYANGDRATMLQRWIEATKEKLGRLQSGQTPPSPDDLDAAAPVVPAGPRPSSPAPAGAAATPPSSSQMGVDAIVQKYPDIYTTQRPTTGYKMTVAPGVYITDPNFGWKFHVSTSQPDKLADVLVNQLGITAFKLEHNSGQFGKNATIYVGSKDLADIVAARIEQAASPYLLPAWGDVFTGNMPFTEHVWGRFSAHYPSQTRNAIVRSKTPTGVDPIEFSNYGPNGIPLLKFDARARNADVDAAMTQSDKLLTNYFGEYYTGSGTGTPGELAKRTRTATRQHLNQTADRFSKMSDDELIAYVRATRPEVTDDYFVNLERPQLLHAAQSAEGLPVSAMPLSPSLAGAAATPPVSQVNAAMTQGSSSAPFTGTPRQTFRTEKGSEYFVDDQGRTWRHKFDDTWHGPYQALYVDLTNEKNRDLAEATIYAQGHNRKWNIGYLEGGKFTKVGLQPDGTIVPIPEGARPALHIYDPTTGQKAFIPAYTEPRVGLTPIEYKYEDGGQRSRHMGHVISEVGEAAPAQAVPAAPDESLIGPRMRPLRPLTPPRSSDLPNIDNLEEWKKWRQEWAAEGGAPPNAKPPTDDNLRALATDAGIPTTDATGKKKNNSHILNFVNKHLGSKYEKLGQMSPRDRWRAYAALMTRAVEKATEVPVAAARIPKPSVPESSLAGLSVMMPEYGGSVVIGPRDAKGYPYTVYGLDDNVADVDDYERSVRYLPQETVDKINRALSSGQWEGTDGLRFDLTMPDGSEASIVGSETRNGIKYYTVDNLGDRVDMPASEVEKLLRRTRAAPTEVPPTVLETPELNNFLKAADVPDAPEPTFGPGGFLAETSEDLPIISGAAPYSQEKAPFRPKETGRQESMLDFRPSMEAGAQGTMDPKVELAAPTPARTVTIPGQVNRLEANVADLAADYKARGMERARAWDQFVIDRGLKPEMDAKKFYAIFDGVIAKTLTGKGETISFQPTHVYKVTGEPVQLYEKDGITWFVTDRGNTGNVKTQYFDMSDQFPSIDSPDAQDVLRQAREKAAAPAPRTVPVEPETPPVQPADVPTAEEIAQSPYSVEAQALLGRLRQRQGSKRSHLIGPATDTAWGRLSPEERKMQQAWKELLDAGVVTETPAKKYSSTYRLAEEVPAQAAPPSRRSASLFADTIKERFGQVKFGKEVTYNSHKQITAEITIDGVRYDVEIYQLRPKRDEWVVVHKYYSGEVGSSKPKEQYFTTGTVSKAEAKKIAQQTLATTIGTDSSGEYVLGGTPWAAATETATVPAPKGLQDDKGRTNILGLTKPQTDYTIGQLEQAALDLEAGKVRAVTIEVPGDGKVTVSSPDQARALAKNFQSPPRGSLSADLPGYSGVQSKRLSPEEMAAKYPEGNLETLQSGMPILPQKDIDAINAVFGAAAKDAKAFIKEVVGNMVRARRSGGARTIQVGEMAAESLRTLDDVEEMIRARLPELLGGTENAMSDTQRLRAIDALDKILSRYDEVLMAADSVGSGVANFALLDYRNRTNLDTWTGFLYPYWYFWSRMPTRALNVALTKPGMVGAFYDVNRGINIENFQAGGGAEGPGLPQRLVGSVPLVNDYRINVRQLMTKVIPGAGYLVGNPFVDPEDAQSDVERWQRTIEEVAPGMYPSHAIIGDWFYDKFFPVPKGENPRLAQRQVGDLLPVPRMGAYAWQGMTGKMASGDWYGLGDEWDAYRARRALSEIVINGKIDDVTGDYAHQMILNIDQGKEAMEGIPEEYQQRAQELADQAIRQSGWENLQRTGSNWLAGMGVQRYPEAEALTREQQQTYNELGYVTPQNPEGSPYGGETAQEMYLDESPELIASWSKSSDTPAADAQRTQLYGELNSLYEQKTAMEEEAANMLMTGQPNASPGDVAQAKKNAVEEAALLLEGAQEGTPSHERLTAGAELQARIDEIQTQLDTLPFSDGEGRDMRNPLEVRDEQANDLIKDMWEYPGHPEWPGNNAKASDKRAYYKARDAYYQQKEQVIIDLLTQPRGPDERDVPIHTEEDAKFAYWRYLNWNDTPRERVHAETYWHNTAVRDSEFNANLANAKSRVPQGDKLFIQYLDTPQGDARAALSDTDWRYTASLLAAYNPQVYDEMVRTFGKDAAKVYAEGQAARPTRPADSAGEAELQAYYDAREAWHAKYPQHEEINLWLNGRYKWTNKEEMQSQEPGRVYDAGVEYAEAKEKFGDNIFDIQRTANAKSAQGKVAFAKWRDANQGDYMRLIGYQEWLKQFSEMPSSAEELPQANWAVAPDPTVNASFMTQPPQQTVAGTLGATTPTNASDAAQKATDAVPTPPQSGVTWPTDPKSAKEWALENEKFADFEGKVARGEIGSGSEWASAWDAYGALGKDWAAKRQFMLDNPEFAAYYKSRGWDAWWEEANDPATYFSGGGARYFGGGGGGYSFGSGRDSNAEQRMDAYIQPRGEFDPMMMMRPQDIRGWNRPDFNLDWTRAGEMLKPPPLQPWRPIPMGG